MASDSTPPEQPDPADRDPADRDPADDDPGDGDPGAPYVHGRDLVPLRRQARRSFRVQQLLDEQAQLRDEIRQLDQQMLDLSARRQHLLERAKRLHDDIHPTYGPCRGRRRRQVSHEAPLPPVARHPMLVIGRELRALCLVFLRQAQRPLTLRGLHAQLHRSGYAIDHHHPTKALADALGHEADAQRCLRVRRGVYSLASPISDASAHDFPVALPDW